MKKLLLIIFSFLSCVNIAFTQNVAFSKKGSLNIVEKVVPPILKVVGSPEFRDATGNLAIDALESSYIVLKVKNQGFGDAYGLKAKMRVEGSDNGISYKTPSVSTIKVGEIRDVIFPITSNMYTVDGKVRFYVSIDEPNDFGVPEILINVETRKFLEPFVKLGDYYISGDNGGSLKKLSDFYLNMSIQNLNQGVAENVKINIEVPDGVFVLDGEQLMSISKLQAGESLPINLKLIVNNKYSSDVIPIKVNINEKFGKFAESANITLKLNDEMKMASVDVKGINDRKNVDIKLASLHSDVDKNIPASLKRYDNKFAIIIGNEDYSSHQYNLKSEANVAYAINDASVFKDYCASAMGIKDDNIFYLTNATSAVMSREIEKVIKLVKLRADRFNDTELIFYYAGHGFPDMDTREAFLIPVDVNASNFKDGYKLSSLYEDLASSNASKITVFMDACFSGGARNHGLIADRGIAISTKNKPLTGNLVVFSATTSEQSALPYNAKKHGMFTYFLLKKLQLSDAECTFDELAEYLKDNVQEYSLRVLNKEQTPMVNYSINVKNQWREWKLK